MGLCPKDAHLSKNLSFPPNLLAESTASTAGRRIKQPCSLPSHPAPPWRATVSYFVRLPRLGVRFLRWSCIVSSCHDLTECRVVCHVLLMISWLMFWGDVCVSMESKSDIACDTCSVNVSCARLLSPECFILLHSEWLRSIFCHQNTYILIVLFILNSLVSW